MNCNCTSQITVPFVKLSTKAIVPTKGTIDAAGYDLYACLDELGDNEYFTIPPFTTRMIPTNIAMEIPQGYFGAIYARSGLASKQSLAPANCVGIIDSDYRGNIMIALRNNSQYSQTILNHSRIAQLIIQKYPDVVLTEVSTLSDTTRGAGGFGSTG